MSLSSLLPYLTGGGGCIVAMAAGYALLLLRKVRMGRDVDELIAKYDAEQVRMAAAYEKVAAANDQLTASLQACRENNNQLLASGQLTTKLLDTLAAVAQQRGGGRDASGN